MLRQDSSPRMEFDRAVGIFSQLHGNRAAAQFIDVSRGKADYWKSKRNDANFHPRSHGGSYNQPRTPEKILMMEIFVWTLVSSDPFLKIGHIKSRLQDQLGEIVSRDWISRLFKSWKWSYKKADWKQLHKYRAEHCKLLQLFALDPKFAELDEREVLRRIPLQCQRLEEAPRMGPSRASCGGGE